MRLEHHDNLISLASFVQRTGCLFRPPLLETHTLANRRHRVSGSRCCYALLCRASTFAAQDCPSRQQRSHRAVRYLLGAHCYCTGRSLSAMKLGHGAQCTLLLTGPTLTAVGKEASRHECRDLCLRLADQAQETGSAGSPISISHSPRSLASWGGLSAAPPGSLARRPTHWEAGPAWLPGGAPPACRTEGTGCWLVSRLAQAACRDGLTAGFTACGEGLTSAKAWPPTSLHFSHGIRPSADSSM